MMSEADKHKDGLPRTPDYVTVVAHYVKVCHKHKTLGSFIRRTFGGTETPMIHRKGHIQ